MTDRAKCPGCGIPTIPDREGLTEEEMFCDRCLWAGSPCPKDPAECWVDDETGEHINATTNERTARHP